MERKINNEEKVIVNRLWKCFLVLLCFCNFFSLNARQPYSVSLTVDLFTGSISDPNMVDLINDLKAVNLAVFDPIYVPNVTPLSLNFDLRGLAAIGSFALNSTDLVVTFPNTGATETFSGSTRDESLQLFRQYVHDGGRHHELLKAYAKFSPIDPIAGNPNSLIAQMAQADYLLGKLSPYSGCDNCCWTAQPILHQFQAGLNFGRAFAGGFDTTYIGLPLRYSYSPDRDWAFIIDAPLTYLANGGASSIIGSVGIGFRYPVTLEWSLTPVLRMGTGGSADLCTGADFVSFGVTSIYNYSFCNYVLSMTNYLSYLTSTNFWLTGLNFNYNLHNYVFKNGLSLSSCEGFDFCGKDLNFAISFVDSCFAKDRLYIRHYDEIGVSFFTSGINPCIDYDCLSLGLTYQFGEHSYKALFVNSAYQF